jgi:hypothetical protein
MLDCALAVSHSNSSMAFTDSSISTRDLSIYLGLLTQAVYGGDDTTVARQLSYFPSTENASSTFPGIPPNWF